MYSTLVILMVTVFGLSEVHGSSVKHQPTYIKDDNKLFTKYETNYDHSTRIKTKIKRKKVLKKVRKIKKSSSINSHKTKKVLTYIPEKMHQEYEELMKNTTKKKEHLKVKFGKDPSDYEPKEKFTNTSESEYFKAFLEGLNLAAPFPTADQCTNAAINSYDDYTETQNNFTYEFEYTKIENFKPIYPLMRTTEAFGTNFADIFPLCYNMSAEMWTYSNDLYQQMGNDFNSLLISFLFTQMSQALQYKKNVDKIEENNENQNYKANFEAYGAILNLMFLQITPRTEGLDGDVYLQNSSLTTTAYPLQFTGSNYTDDNFDVGDDDIVLQNYSAPSKAPSTQVREPGSEIWRPHLADYTTFDSAWKALQRNVPQGFYSGAPEITAGDKVAAMVTIGCGLALAYVFELNREGIQVNSMEEVNTVLAMFDMNPLTRLQPLSQTSLNIQSILENGSKQITPTMSPEEREDEFAEMLLDIASELPFGLNR